MKIIILNDFAFVNGGVEQVVVSSSIGLAESGYDVTLFTAIGPIDDSLKNIKNLKVICLTQCDILNDPKRWRAIVSGLWNFKSASKLKKLLMENHPNNTIVHVHAISKALTVSCIKVAMDLNFKIIYHMHEYGVVCPNLGFFNYPKQAICTLKPLSYQCIKTNCDKRSYYHKNWRCLRHWIQRDIAQVPQKIKNFVYISNFSINILKKYLPENSNFYLVRNPVDSKKQNRVEVSRNCYFAFVGRLSEEKNPILLADAANKLNLPVMFVGAGACENKIKNICPHAIVTGWVDSTKVKEYLKLVRCLVFPSAWYETQGLVIAEAASIGIPAIVSDICAAKEYIDHGKNGMIFQNNNSKSLEKALIQMQNDFLVKRMGEDAYRKFWENDNSIGQYTKDIIAVYKKVLSNSAN